MRIGKKSSTARQIVLTAAVVLGFAMSFNPALATGGPKGSDLLEQCMTKLNTPQAQCTSFISGIIAGHLLSVGTSKPFFCIPEKANAKKTVMKYLRKHADELDRDAAELILTALADAWPCTD